MQLKLGLRRQGDHHRQTYQQTVGPSGGGPDLGVCVGMI